MSTASVKVAVRVRPMATKELLSNSKDCTEIIPGTQQIIVGGGPSSSVGTDTTYTFSTKSFTFDYLFDDTSTQSQLYSIAVAPLVDKFLEGFNATILAYGQTGSGKTYSMGIGLDSIDEGIVPSAIKTIFEYCVGKDAHVTVSFMELYNEELVDLLNPRPRSASANSAPTIREDGSGNIVWMNLSEEKVKTTDELLTILQKGSIMRTTGSTDMNATSSRSHAIFTVTLRQSHESGNLVSKFHFVDLAGSERLKRTNAEGDRKKEGISINQGLLALGNVISALGDETRKSGHVPYRDSKLTRMLQDSLGGNSQTLMLACVSPSDLNYGETVNTLHYANRARNIKNRVAINQDWGNGVGGETARELKSLRSTISQLKTEIAVIRAGKDIIMDEGGSNRKEQFNQRRERDHLADIERLTVESGMKQFQFERFQFLSLRLSRQVKSLSEEVIQVTTERDEAIRGKCAALKDGLYSKRVRVHSQDSVENGKRSLEEEEMQGSVREYVKVIGQLKLQLAESEDKLAWQYEAMARLGQRKKVVAWTEFEREEQPSSSRVEQLKKKSKEEREGEKCIMMAIRQNIQISDGLPTAAVEEVEEVEEGNDIYLLINKLQNDIVQHEALAENVQKREDEYIRMQKGYEYKLSQLQMKMSQFQKEHITNLNKMSSKEKSQANSKYEEMKKRLDSEILDTRRKLGENSRLQINSKPRAEKLTNELQATISALKGEKAGMLQELRAQTQKHRNSKNADGLLIAKLKRGEKNAFETAKRLERSNRLQRVLINQGKQAKKDSMNNELRLKKVIQSLKRAVTPSKVSKYSSPLKRSGRFNEMLASVNSPVRLTVSQSLAEVRPEIELRAQLKKQMIDKELKSTVLCRRTQRSLHKLQQFRNRLTEEQKELISERERVVKAYYQATGEYDHNPQYMDERVQLIDTEVTSIDNSMIALEKTIKHHSGGISAVVDLNWENAMNLLRSLDRGELEATLAYFMEDLVALRTMEEEYQIELEGKDKTTSNLQQELTDIRRLGSEVTIPLLNTKSTSRPVALSPTPFPIDYDDDDSEEPKMKKSFDMLSMGALGKIDVFKRLAKHTQASQAKVIQRSQVDKESLLDVAAEKRRSLSELEPYLNE